MAGAAAGAAASGISIEESRMGTSQTRITDCLSQCNRSVLTGDGRRRVGIRVPTVTVIGGEEVLVEMGKVEGLASRNFLVLRNYQYAIL